jgi:hypothetical protein
LVILFVATFYVTLNIFMRNALSRLTIVPPAAPGAPATALRSHIAAIVSPTHTNPAQAMELEDVELPEDRGPTSGIMLRDATREEIDDTLEPIVIEDDQDDVFEMGLADSSGEYDRERLLTAAGYSVEMDRDASNDTKDTHALPNVDGDWEFYRAITPPIPAEALIPRIQEKYLTYIPPIPEEPTLLDLSAEEEILLARATALAKVMQEKPRQAFQYVADQVKKVPYARRRFFWNQVYHERQPQKPTKNEKASDIVAKHAQTIEAIAYQVIRHERSTGCYELEALEIGFQCLPAFSSIECKDAFHRALREKTEELRAIKYIQPLALTALTPDNVYMLSTEDKALAEKVVETITTGIKDKKTELQVLMTLATLAPGKREIIWHFYHLLKKPDSRIQNITKQDDIAAIYRDHLASISKQLVTAMAGQWHKVLSFLDIGFQMLPHNIDERTTVRLRRALKNNLDARIQAEKINGTLGILSIDANVVLEKLVNQLVDKFTSEPFNVARHVREVLEPLDERQKVAVLKVIGPQINDLRAAKKIQLSTQAEVTATLIAASPDQKHSIMQQITKGMKPLDIILFHEMMGESLLHGQFGDYARLGKLPSKPQTPLIGEKINDEVIQQHRQRIDLKTQKAAQTVEQPAEEPIETHDSNFLEEMPPAPQTLWQSITSTVSRGVKHISNWWGSVKNAVSEFSFMDFVRGHRSVVGATTVIAALNGYQGYQDMTRVVEVATPTHTTVDVSLEQSEGMRLQASAFSQYLGMTAEGRPRIINYAPVYTAVTESTIAMQRYRHGLDNTTQLPLATAEQSQQMTPSGYEAVTTLRGEEQVNIISPWEYRVDQHDAMANIYNALGAYMNSRTFRLAYNNYVAGEMDQSTLFNDLVTYNPRAHHILQRISHGDTITFGTNRAGNVVIVSWYNAEMINMLAGEPAIEIKMNRLANLGEFSRSSTALARNTPHATTSTQVTVAMLNPSFDQGE